MATILVDEISKYYFMRENGCILIQICLTFVMGVIYSTWAFVEVLTLRRLGTKLWPEPMMTQFPDEHMHHQASKIWKSWIRATSSWTGQLFSIVALWRAMGVSFWLPIINRSCQREINRTKRSEWQQLQNTKKTTMKDLFCQNRCFRC